MRLYEIIKPKEQTNHDVFRNEEHHGYTTSLNNRVDIYFNNEDYDTTTISFQVNNRYDSNATQRKDKEILPGVLYEILYYLKSRPSIKHCSFDAYHDDRDKKQLHNIPLGPSVHEAKLVISKILKSKSVNFFNENDVNKLNDYINSPIENDNAEIAKTAPVYEIIKYYVADPDKPHAAELISKLVELNTNIDSHKPDGVEVTKNRRKSLYTKMVEHYFSREWDVTITNNSFDLVRKNRLGIIPNSNRDYETCVKILREEPTTAILIEIPKKLWNKGDIKELILENDLITSKTISDAPEDIQIEVLKDRPSLIDYIKDITLPVLLSMNNDEAVIRWFNLHTRTNMNKKEISHILLPIIERSSKLLFDIDKKFRTRAMYEAAAEKLTFIDWWNALFRGQILLSHIPEELLSNEDWMTAFNSALNWRTEDIPRKYQSPRLWHESISIGTRSINDVPKRYVNEQIPKYPLLAFRLPNPSKQQIAAAENYIIDNPSQLSKNKFLVDKFSERFRILLLQQGTYGDYFNINIEESENVINAYIRHETDLHAYGNVIHNFTHKNAELFVSLYPKGIELLDQYNSNIITPRVEKLAIDCAYKNSESAMQFTKISQYINNNQNKTYYAKLLSDFITRNALLGRPVGNVGDELFNIIFNDFLKFQFYLPNLGKFLEGNEQSLTDTHITKLKQLVINYPALLNGLPPIVKGKVNMQPIDYNHNFYSIINSINQGHTYGGVRELIDFLNNINNSTTLTYAQISKLEDLSKTVPSLLEKLPDLIRQRITNKQQGDAELGRVRELAERLNQ